MYSHYSANICRRLPLLAGLALLLAAPSCGHRAAPSVPHPPVSSAASALPSPPHKPTRPKALPPISFPDLNTGQISSLRFSPDGRRLAFGYGTDAEVTVWNLETGRLDWQRHVEGASGGPLTMDPHGRFMVVECSDPDEDINVPIWVSTLDGRLRRKLPGYLESFNTLAPRLRLQGRFFVTSGHRLLVHKGRSLSPVAMTEVYDTRTWRRVDHALGASGEWIPLSPSGHVLRHPKAKPNIGLTTEDGQPNGAWWNRVPAFPFANNEYDAARGDYFARVGGSGGSRGQAEVWDVRRKKRFWVAVTKRDSFLGTTISPDGATLAVGTIAGYVYLWDLRTGRLLHQTHASKDVIRCLTYSPNGRVLAAAGDEYSGATGVRLLDARSGKTLAVLKAAFPDNGPDEKDWTLDHPDWFAALPDLSYLASEGAEKKMRTPGRARDASVLTRFRRPRRVRAALAACYRR